MRTVVVGLPVDAGYPTLPPSSNGPSGTTELGGGGVDWGVPSKRLPMPLLGGIVEHALRFDLRAEVLPGPIQLDVAGCLTEANCQALLKVLDRALTLVGCPRIIVNLSGLDHLDPGGLRALEAHVATRAHDRTAPGHDLLQPRAAVSIQAPPAPRHCSETGEVKAFRGILLENVVASRGAAIGAFTRDRRPGLAPVAGRAAERSAHVG